MRPAALFQSRVKAMLRLVYAACLAAFLLPRPGTAQSFTDSLFTWQGYGREARCQLSLYETTPGEDRPYAFIIREIAENIGPSTVTDARYLAELIGRQLDVDPAEAIWVYHWGGFSYAGAAPDSGKELFLRATFRRTSSNSLGSPYWKVITREDVEELTDRQFR